MAALYRLEVAAGSSVTVHCLLVEQGAEVGDLDLGLEKGTDELVAACKKECDEFYGELVPKSLSTSEREVAVQAYAGLLWTKQFFFYDVQKWLKGELNFSLFSPKEDVFCLNEHFTISSFSFSSF